MIQFSICLCLTLKKNISYKAGDRKKNQKVHFAVYPKSSFTLAFLNINLDEPQS